MPYNGSGTFSLTYNWATEQASSPIEIAKLDTQESDIASGLSNCILRDGTGLPSTAIPWNSQALTGVSNLSAERVTVTGSTVPANGMYLSAANTVAWATASTLRGSVNSTGAWTFSVPSAGVAMTVTGVAGTKTLQLNGTTNYAWLSMVDAATSQDWSILSGLSAGNFTIRNSTSATNPLTISTAGNVAIAAPSSGNSLTVATTGSNYAVVLGNATHSKGIRMGMTAGGSFIDGVDNTGSVSYQPLDIGASALALLTGGTQRVSVGSAGNVTINAPSSGTALTVTGISGTSAFAGGLVSIGEGVGLSTGANVYSLSTNQLNLGTNGAAATNLFTNSAARVQISSGGNVTINAASSGDELTVTGSVVATSFAGALTGNVTGNVTGSSGSTTGNAATATALQTARNINGVSFNGTANITVTAAADTLSGTTLAALSGANLTALNATQLTSGTVPAARITSVETTATISSNLIGFRDIPRQTSGFNRGQCSAISAGVTLNTSDMAAGYTFSLYNDSASSVTITQGAGVTLRLHGTATTGNRTLLARGFATFWCNSGTEAIAMGDVT